jgi:N,N-dimethylformamidase beta subunit-like, C-terminal
MTSVVDKLSRNDRINKGSGVSVMTHKDREMHSRRKVLRSVGAAAVAGLSGAARVAMSNSSASSASTPRSVSNGYTDRQSYRPGDEVSLFLSGSGAGNITALPLDQWGGGEVLRIQANLYAQAPTGAVPWQTGFGYRESAFFRLPAQFSSGVYLVDALVPLIVKRDLRAPPAEVVILYPTNTVQAYNDAGGRSMYTPVRAPIVSFQRPVGWTSNVAFFSAFLEWFANPPIHYSYRYLADIDLEDYQEIAGSKLLVIIGHSEYWSRQARENFDQFVREGGNVLILSGNTMWWQVRYGGSGTQLICYKTAPDPVADPLLRTINWPSPQLAYPTLRSIGADFPHGGFGVGYPASGTGFRVLAPHSPVFEGLRLAAGDVIEMPTLEYDGAPLLNNPATSGTPRLDNYALEAYRAEIIGYEYCGRSDQKSVASGPPTKVATWLAYQRTATSGVVINGASTNWCSRTGAFGSDGLRIRKIILNMMELLVSGRSPFSG